MYLNAQQYNMTGLLFQVKFLHLESDVNSKWIQWELLLHIAEEMHHGNR